MNDMSDTPTYDNVRLDLGVDPADQQGHAKRVAGIIAKYPSVILAQEAERAKPPRNTKIARKPPKRR